MPGRVRCVLRGDAHDEWSGRGLAVTLAACVCLLAAGCATQTTAKHATVVAAATAPVVDQATAAYQTANSIHDQAENYDAVTDFDKTSPVYNPRTVKPLLSPQAIDARLTVLQGLQSYVKTVVAVTTDTDSTALDAASKSVGNSLTSLGNSLLPAGQSSQTQTIIVDGTSTTETILTPVNAISQGEQNAITAGINALGQYLVSRKVKQELPGVIVKMDPVVKQLCELLANEVDTLSSQEKIDYDKVIDRETLFIRSSNLNAVEKRDEIMKLPALGRQQQASAQQLKQLRAALVTLVMTHHAMAADAQGNNPESLKNKLGELEAAGTSVGKFYSSLPASQ